MFKTIKQRRNEQGEYEPFEDWMDEDQVKIMLDTLFNEKIETYLLKYPIEERNQFSNKLSFAKEVVNGGTNIYITQRAEALGITPIEFAQIIIKKAEEFQAFYAQCEIERDEQMTLYKSLINSD